MTNKSFKPLIDLFEFRDKDVRRLLSKKDVSICLHELINGNGKLYLVRNNQILKEITQFEVIGNPHLLKVYFEKSKNSIDYLIALAAKELKSNSELRKDVNAFTSLNNLWEQDVRYYVPADICYIPIQFYKIIL